MRYVILGINRGDHVLDDSIMVLGGADTQFAANIFAKAITDETGVSTLVRDSKTGDLIATFDK